MLQLKNIKKTYHVGDIETRALDDISVSFREKEFVAILGKSGSGKTTCLNIVGGLDRYDSGDLIIKGKPTKDFKDKDWDAYRNNSIGFVFQSYNLIMHLSIVQNVELGMTLSGVSNKEKQERALAVLKQVGLEEHLHKKPNQLSGGQMQRVAIARALANDPEILLCDEPTGALDTHTSIQIMDLIKEVANDRLVIMVTHNPELAKTYADRIIEFQDGKIISDSHPFEESSTKDAFSLKKTSMSFWTALKLSFNNIMTKKGRTFLTAFASSIGIIGIAVILSLSTGFQKQIDAFQEDALAEFPIIISQQTADVNMEEMMLTMNEENSKEEFPTSQEVQIFDPSTIHKMHTNTLDENYMEYVKNIDPEIASSIGYTRIVSMNVVRKTDDDAKLVYFSNQDPNQTTQKMSGMTSMNGIGLSSYPESLVADEQGYLEKNYDVLAGAYPTEITDLVLVVDTKNRLDKQVLQNLGFTINDEETIAFEDLVGTEFKIVNNNDYYTKSMFNTYMPSSDYEAMYQSDAGITVRIAGIVRQKQDVDLGILGVGIAYNDALSQMVIDSNMNSDIVTSQKDSDVNVMTLDTMDAATKESMLAYLGGSETPFMIMVYPTNFENKDAVLAYLDAFNENLEADDQVVYTDLAATMSDMTGSIMDGITLVLVAFAAISLIVSLIMICIITYTSVLERTKEIGILKALGARKKDITRVFDAETCILGVFSGLLGILIAWLLTFPINNVIYAASELENVAQLQLDHAIILVIISTVLTMLGGHVPARMASKKDAVTALRSE